MEILILIMKVFVKVHEKCLELFVLVHASFSELITKHFLSLQKVKTNCSLISGKVLAVRTLQTWTHTGEKPSSFSVCFSRREISTLGVTQQKSFEKSLSWIQTEVTRTNQTETCDAVWVLTKDWREHLSLDFLLHTDIQKSLKVFVWLILLL